jgi:hypothetical protein
VHRLACKSVVTRRGEAMSEVDDWQECRESAAGNVCSSAFGLYACSNVTGPSVSVDVAALTSVAFADNRRMHGVASCLNMQGADHCT